MLIQKDYRQQKIRKSDFMEFEEIENGIKATVPLITEDDIKVINNDFDGIINRFSKMIIKEKDLALAQYIIKTQQEQINELKTNSIPKKKIEDKIKELKENIPYLSKFKDWKNKEYTNEDIIDNIIQVLQELLEEDK